MSASEPTRLLGEVMALMNAAGPRSPFISEVFITMRREVYLISAVDAQLDKIRHLYAGSVNQ